MSDTNDTKGQLGTSFDDDIKVRHMRADDIPVIEDIDSKITQRASTWENVDIYLAGEPLLSFVAEYQGEVVGFLLGDVKSYEFGLAQSAWIETLGVDPAYQRHGVGGRLVKALIDHCHRTGINTVQALIKESDDDLKSFLLSCSFKRGEFINMELAL